MPSDNILDVFNSDGFNAVALTQAINKLPYQPNQIEKLGLFEEEGVTQNVVAFEEMNGKLSLLPTVNRGGPSTSATAEKRKLRSLVVPHIPYEDALTAADIQGVREFGSPDGMMTPEKALNRKLERMLASHKATLEYQRMGAIKGIVLDSDGSTTLYNLFTVFNISAPSDVDFLLGTDTTQVGSLITGIVEVIEAALGAETYEHIHCLCGKTFWAKFVEHPEVKWAFQYFQESKVLREDLRYQGFEYKGVTFQKYRGRIGSVDFVGDSDCRFFPVGTPGLFVTKFGPADFLEAVNTPGLPVYAKQAPDKFGRSIDIHTQSNPLSVCTRPGVLVKGTTSN